MSYSECFRVSATDLRVESMSLSLRTGVPSAEVLEYSKELETAEAGTVPITG